MRFTNEEKEVKKNNDITWEWERKKPGIQALLLKGIYTSMELHALNENERPNNFP